MAASSGECPEHGTVRPFARFGAEKMICDARMGPQALACGDHIVIVYQAGEGSLPGHPHLVSYNRRACRWTRPLRLGTAAGADHHFAPILWADDAGRMHVLFNCHNGAGEHLVCPGVDQLDQWAPAAPIAESLTYPWVRRLGSGVTALVYRVGGHLGYSVYRTSRRGGEWGQERAFLDFDRDPADEADRSAGTYMSAAPARDGESLHVGFCWWDERRSNAHPRYRFRRDILTRYNLYYLRLNTVSGKLTTADGQPLEPPVNRRAAEAALVQRTWPELTNFPAVAADADDRPMLLAPISEGSPWRCRFHFFRHDGRTWRQGALGETDNIWAAARLLPGDGGTIQADLITGEGKAEETVYGGGSLQRWQSADGGRSWKLARCLDPQPGLLYNNFQPVLTVEGFELPDTFVTHGWQGPGGIWAVKGYPTESRNRGLAFLCLGGRWM